MVCFTTKTIWHGMATVKIHSFPRVYNATITIGTGGAASVFKSEQKREKSKKINWMLKMMMVLLRQQQDYVPKVGV